MIEASRRKQVSSPPRTKSTWRVLNEYGKFEVERKRSVQLGASVPPTSLDHLDVKNSCRAS
jgi:hypothetical protein